MVHLFSSGPVSGGYSDKVADQISDVLLDRFLAYDNDAHCAIETSVTTGQVMIMGEVHSKEYVDLQTIARRTVRKIGYTKSEYQFDGDSCGIMSVIHEQSEGIDRGMDRTNEDERDAEDQDMMSGYAINETENYMPVLLDLVHLIMRALVDTRREGKEMTYLRPDSKSQATIEYNGDHAPRCIHTTVMNTQHDEFDNDDNRMLAKIRADVINILIPRVGAACDDKARTPFNDGTLYCVNPTGEFATGGPHGNTGLIGRKIVVDTYGGKGAHGGGTFLGKDPSKVDRSAACASRYIARNLVAINVSDEMLAQISYAIGEARLVNICVDTYGRGEVEMTDGEITQKTGEMYDLRPKAIEKKFGLRNPIYFEAAAYGHMGQQYEVKKRTLESRYHEMKIMQTELFTWEKLDGMEHIRRVFGI